MYIRSPVYVPAFVIPLLETVTSSEKRKSEVSSCYRVTKHHKKPSHSRDKRKSLIIIRIQEALWRKLNNLKPLFRWRPLHLKGGQRKCSCIEGQIMPTRNNNCRKSICVCHDLSVWNKWQNVFLQSIIYPSEKKLIWTSILAWGKSRVLPTPFLHLNDFFHWVLIYVSLVHV